MTTCAQTPTPRLFWRRWVWLATVAGAMLVGEPMIGFSLAGTAFAQTPLLAHQAIYDLALTKSRRSPAVGSVQGRIAYTFDGNACEGYTTEFRQVSQIQAGEGNPALSDMRSTSWEDAAGKAYRFHIETRTNDTLSSVVDGEAEHTAKGLVIRLKQPNKKTFTVDGQTVFPTMQVERILAAAREGKSLLELVVYDGSGDGEKLYNTLTVIGQPISGDRVTGASDVAVGDATLKGLTRWPVTVSYYERLGDKPVGEQTPVYAMAFELYANGVSRALTLDYNDFVVGGAMTKYSAKPARPCK